MDTIIDIQGRTGKRPNSARIIGGKGKNILFMSKAHINIPDGIILATKAFDNYLDFNKLEAPDQYVKRNGKSRLKLQKQLKGASIPPRLKAEIYDALKRKGLANKGLVVRSSATIEDSASASFAGMFKSFLNVNSIDAIADSIKQVYDSAFNEKVLKYLSNSERIQDRIGMAVVIQEMICGDVSGVAFTKDPISTDRFLIEAVIGLNDALVSGRITPSRFEIDKESKKIVYRDIRKQRIVQVPFLKGGTKFVKNNSTIENLFSDGMIKEITDSGMRLESLIGQGQDIEWTIRDGDLYILQSRDITTPKILQKSDPLEFGGIILNGYAASHGIVKGRAFRIKKPTDKVLSGRILVFKFTNTDYIHQIRKAKGLITEEGGMLSHAAIVSRELKIPCVVGVKNATAVIKDGTEIILDGAGGTVYLVNKNSKQRKANKIKKPGTLVGKQIDLASLYCIDTAKRAIYDSNVFYYEIFDGVMTYYSDKISKVKINEYIGKNRLNLASVSHGDMIKFYIIDGLPVYFKDKKLAGLYKTAITAVQKFDPGELRRSFECIRLFILREITEAHKIECRTYESCLKKFFYYRRTGLAFLLVDTVLCEGYCLRTIYRNLKPIMDKHGIRFSELLDSFEGSINISPQNIKNLKKKDYNIIKTAADYYRITKRWKGEAYTIYCRMGAAGDKFEKEQAKLAKKLNKLGKNKKDYRKLYTEAVNRFG